MVYQWKIPQASISAQVVGEEFERIHSKNGRLEPEDIVNESRSEKAPLHSCFEWDDTKAAEKYRVSQAGDLIRAIVTVTPLPEKTTEPVRAYVSVRGTYQPIATVVNTPDLYAELLANAEKELEAFNRKYSSLKQLEPVITAIKAYKSKRPRAEVRPDA